jgi:hydroxymethylpyrimidine/phosphomethylpyrimidine kinase
MNKAGPLPVWVFAGVDPSGGAGITQDFRVLSSLGLAPRAFPTSLTVQNIQEVRNVHPVAPSVFREMIRALGEVERPLGLKIGLLPDSLGDVTADAIREWCPGIPVVLDPVFRFGSGDRFHDPVEFRELASLLLPLSEIVTPNLPEAEILLERSIPEEKEALIDAAREIRERFRPSAVYLKGGHAKGLRKIDVCVDGSGLLVLDHPEVRLPGLHGGGCSLASLILGFRVRERGHGISDAAFKARELFQESLRWEGEREGGHRRTLEGYFSRPFLYRDP